jgi:hypothetical protein
MARVLKVWIFLYISFFTGEELLEHTLRGPLREVARILPRLVVVEASKARHRKTKISHRVCANEDVYIPQLRAGAYTVP